MDKGDSRGGGYVRELREGTWWGDFIIGDHRRYAEKALGDGHPHRGPAGEPERGLV